LRALSDLSQFLVYAGRQEITKLDRCPAGLIVPHTFLVTWQVENPAGGFIDIIQANMTPLISVQEGWQLLHHDHPRVFQEASINYRGDLNPWQIVQAEVIGKELIVAVDFESIRKRHIRFTHELIPNMVSWADIHAHFQAIDKRISPFGCYVQEENRPCFENTLLEFHLAEEVNVPDMFDEQGGVAGGTNSKGQILPPVIFPTVIDTTGGTKMNGALKGIPGDWSSVSETDSDADAEDEDFHKLRQISHAVRLAQSITVKVRGQYQCSAREEEVSFQKEFVNEPVPSHILEPLQVAFRSIEVLAAYYQGTGLPRQCMWTQAGVPREHMEISVSKPGKGIQVTYGYVGAR
jgi:hypothetical protein